MYYRAKTRRSSKMIVFHARMNRSISHSLLLVRLFHRVSSRVENTLVDVSDGP